MPKILFSELPRGLWRHLTERAGDRRIPIADLGRLQDRARSVPYAPAGDWYKDFGSFGLCGSGKYLKTFLAKGMKPCGNEIV